MIALNADLLSITRKLTGRVLSVACTIKRDIPFEKTLVPSKAAKELSTGTNISSSKPIFLNAS